MNISRLIDRWTLVHFAFWFVVGANFHLFGIPAFWQWFTVIGGVIVWELIEMALEHYKVIKGKESFLDRWISDPIIGILGAGAGMYWVS